MFLVTSSGSSFFPHFLYNKKANPITTTAAIAIPNIINIVFDLTLGVKLSGYEQMTGGSIRLLQIALNT